MKGRMQWAAVAAWLGWQCLAGAQTPGFGPGQRVLLDAHNCYPYEGRWTDRIDRALAAGTPLAIEVDLVWNPKAPPGDARIVARHGGTAEGNEPTLRAYFFEKIRPAVEAALASGDRSSWPLFTLNINDLRTDEPAFYPALWRLLADYEPWLCTAPKGADVSVVSSLDTKPVLILTSDGPAQAKVFCDDVPPGGRLRLFAAGKPDRPADNFRRWVNYSWRDVETEGQPRGGEWTSEEAARLKTLVDGAHRRGYWIRFYTLNGHSAVEGAAQGWGAGVQLRLAAGGQSPLACRPAGGRGLRRLGSIHRLRPRLARGLERGEWAAAGTRDLGQARSAMERASPSLNSGRTFRLGLPVRPSRSRLLDLPAQELRPSSSRARGTRGSLCVLRQTPPRRSLPCRAPRFERSFPPLLGAPLVGGVPAGEERATFSSGACQLK